MLHSELDVADSSRKRRAGRRKLVPVLSLPPWVSLSKSLCLSESRFSHL